MSNVSLVFLQVILSMITYHFKKDKIFLVFGKTYFYSLFRQFIWVERAKEKWNFIKLGKPGYTGINLFGDYSFLPVKNFEVNSDIRIIQETKQSQSIISFYRKII